MGPRSFAHRLRLQQKAMSFMMSHVVKEKYVGKVEMRLRVSGVIVLHHTRLTYTATAALQHA